MKYIFIGALGTTWLGYFIFPEIFVLGAIGCILLAFATLLN